MDFSRRTLLKWIGIGGAGVAGEILVPGMLSLPAEAVTVPGGTTRAFQYDFLLNDYLLKLSEREFHEVFVVPGVMQIQMQIAALKPIARPHFISPKSVRVGGSAISFRDGRVFVLERGESGHYGPWGTLHALVNVQQDQPTEVQQ